jgi:hypothetical protein
VVDEVDHEREFVPDDRPHSVGEIYAEAFASIGRSISLAKDWDSKLVAWRNGVREALTQWHGIERGDIVDECYALAEAKDLTNNFSVDHIQREMSDVIAEVDAKPRQRNGKDQYHGPDAEAEIQPKNVPAPIPLIFPFPIKGTEIPRRPWIVPGLLLRRHVTMLVAPPGSGKSLLTLQLGMVCAAGRMDWAGWRPRMAARVLFINSEDDDDEIKRRLYATAAHMRFDVDALDGLAFAESPETIVIARADSRTKTVTRTPMVEQIVTTLLHNAIDIVVVDPFAETFIGNESDNSELKWAAVLWREVARRTRAAVMLVHHAKKYSGSMAGDMDAARGGGSLAGVCRIVGTLFNMTAEEAERMKISSDKRANYLRFDDAKANLTLITYKARWFEKISYTLPNSGDGEPADEVGVLHPWSPPSAFDNIDVGLANAILNKFSRGNEIAEGKFEPYAPTPKAGQKPKRWAGYVITSLLNVSDDDAKSILDEWIKQGVITVFQAKITGSKRPTDPCVKVVETMRPGRVLDRDDQMDLSM